MTHPMTISQPPFPVTQCLLKRLMNKRPTPPHKAELVFADWNFIKPDCLSLAPSEALWLKRINQLHCGMLIILCPLTCGGGSDLLSRYCLFWKWIYLLCWLCFCKSHLLNISLTIMISHRTLFWPRNSSYNRKTQAMTCYSLVLPHVPSPKETSLIEWEG